MSCIFSRRTSKSSLLTNTVNRTTTVLPVYVRGDGTAVARVMLRARKCVYRSLMAIYTETICCRVRVSIIYLLTVYCAGTLYIQYSVDSSTWYYYRTSSTVLLYWCCGHVLALNITQRHITASLHLILGRLKTCLVYIHLVSNSLAIYLLL